jgi:ribonuclease T2
MKLYQRLALGGLSLLTMLLLIAGCEARQAATSDAGQKAGYDYYLLALSLAPAFCEDALGNRRVPHQCRDVDLADFQRQPLTLHGLWPNNRSGRHPFYCNGERDRGGMCDQTRVRLPESLAAQLAVAMPGTADCLDRHEWAKHGSCTGLEMADYFSESLRLTQRANQAMGEALSRHAGGEIGLDTLRAQIAARDPALLESVVFDCRTPKSDTPARRSPMLREVRIYFHVQPDGRPGAPMNFREAGARHYNSGCPAARAYIDAP